MLLNYLPKFMANIEEIRAIMNSCEENITDINTKLQEILENFFIKDANLYAIERYENIVGIIPNLVDSLDTRKDKIISKYNETLPFTLEKLILMLNNICGENNYKLWMEYDKFILNFRLALNKKELKESVNIFLDRIVPVNIILKVDLDYNNWIDVKYKLWGNIIDFSWKYIKEDEKIKE